MQPDTGSKVLYPSFASPLPPPVQDPDSGPTISVTVACSWLPYIRGALWQLTQQWAWPQDDPELVYLSQQRAESLIALFIECETPIPPIACSYSFRDSPDGWGIDPDFGFGTYVGTEGYEGTHVSGVSQRALTLLHTFATPSVVTRVTWTYNSDSDGSGANNASDLFIDNGSGFVLVHGSTVMAGGIVREIWEGEFDTVSRIEIQMNSGTTLANFFVTDATINGLSVDGCGT